MLVSQVLFLSNFIVFYVVYFHGHGRMLHYRWRAVSRSQWDILSPWFVCQRHTLVCTCETTSTRTTLTCQYASCMKVSSRHKSSASWRAWERYQ